MVVSDAIHNIMGGMESTAGVRLHNHRRKLKQRFDIIKKLGQGTYGKVQLGINKETGQEVAIKTIKKSKIQTEADLIRIRREIQIMSSVQHPNIIHIYEVFENREKMVLVMEYAAGGELYDYLSERKVLIESEARRIFRQISTAVYYCHKHKICHRDLKLENILLDEHGSAKIADFGLSNVFDDHHLLGTYCGSPLYASPEIVKGTPYHGPEVDCWSLGVLLYTLVYGAMPFDGSNFKRLVKQISQGDYFEPKKPSPASTLIHDMLHINPAQRADIVKICSHWWMNDGQGDKCIEIAEELANQTPVRLDLLLSLAPTTPGAEDNLLVKDLATAVAGPTRSQSVGSLMELDHPKSYDAGKRRASAAGQEDIPKDINKRKIEAGSSMEEANTTGAKRKERSRRRERSAERTSERKHRSSSRTKQTKQPIVLNVDGEVLPPATCEDILISTTCDEPSGKNVASNMMDLDVVAPEPVLAPGSAEEDKMNEAASLTTDIPVAEDSSSAVKELNIIKDAELNESNLKSSEDVKKINVKRKKKVESKTEDLKEAILNIEESLKAEAENARDVIDSSRKEDEKVSPEKKEAGESNVTAKAEVPEKETSEVKTPVKVVKKVVKKKSDLSPGKLAAVVVDKMNASEEPATSPAKPVVRRRSKIFESEIQKFNNLGGAPEVKPALVEKPKKVFIPGVKVSDFKKAYERKSSVDLSSVISIPTTIKTSPSKKTVSERSPKDKEIDSDKSSTESSNLKNVCTNSENVERSSQENNKSQDCSMKPALSQEKPANEPVTLVSQQPGSVMPVVEAIAKPVVEAIAKPVVEPVVETLVEPKQKTILKPAEAIGKPKEVVKQAEPISHSKNAEKLEVKLVLQSKEAKKVAEEEIKKLEAGPPEEDAIKQKKKTAIEIIGNAIAKPPKPLLDKLKIKSTKASPESLKKTLSADMVSPSGKKLVKIQVGPNEIRNAVLQVSTPELIRNFNYNETAKAETKDALMVNKENNSQNVEEDQEKTVPTDKKVSTKVEITLKSSTLPRRKTSKAEIQLGKPAEYRSEVEHMVGGVTSSKLRNQRSEVAFPVAAAIQQPHRSLSVEPDSGLKKPRECIIPIKVEHDVEERPIVMSPPPCKPPPGPIQQRSLQSQRSSSLSRQSTLESDTESSSTVGPEPIRKSPREFIIPIAVEGGGYITPRAGSLEPGEPNSASSDHGSQSSFRQHRPHRFSRPMRMTSLLSESGASEDEGFNSLSSPFSSLNRHNKNDGDSLEDEFGSHMHRLRSSRPSRVPVERSDSVSSAEEEDDDDGFELLTAESLFSTLLSRVRNLTQRLNVDDSERPCFPSSRFMNHNFPSHSSFFSNMEPLSRRVSETSQFSRPLSRDELAPSWRRSTSRDTSDGDSIYSDSVKSNSSTLPRANVVRVTVHVPSPTSGAQ